MSELFLPAQPGSFSLLQALVQGLVPSTWDSALFDSLGAKGRWALYQSSTGCRDWVLVGPQTATVTLTAYEGIQDAVWERQVAGAEHRLALRGPRRGNTLVLRQPSPNQAALHSLLCITPAAGRAVSELAVLQLQSSEPGWEGVFTPWLRALPWAFPNLTTLRIDRLCGRMPPPAMLPGLRQLHVKPVHIYFDDHPKRPDTIENMFASIARYTPQLHSLHVGHPHKDARLSWHGVFDRVSTTLQRVSVAGDLCREGIQLLCQYAPALQYLSVESFHVDTDTEAGETAAGQPAASEQVAGLTWQVCDVTVGKGGSVRLDMLPCTTAAGLVIRRTKGRRVECFLDLADTEGISESAQHRVGQWRMAGPVDMLLALPTMHMSATQIQQCVTAAVQQLSGLFPAGSTIDVGCRHYEEKAAAHLETIRIAETALAAAAAQHMPGVVPKTPTPEYPDNHQYSFLTDMRAWRASWRAKQSGLGRESEKALGLDDLLGLQQSEQSEICPSTGAGIKISVYKIDDEASVTEYCTELQGLTILVTGTLTVTLSIETDTRTHRDPDHPAALRQLLRLLRSMRFCAASDSAYVVVRLKYVHLTQATTQELRALPQLDIPCSLDFEYCDWPVLDVSSEPDPDVYPADSAQTSQLPAVIPTCYTQWIVSGYYSGQHILALCAGAVVRGEECRPLQLVCDALSSDDYYDDAPRSAVEAYILERGLGKWVAPIEWV